MPVKIESSFISEFVSIKSDSAIVVNCDGVVLGISIPYLASVELKSFLESNNFNPQYKQNIRGKILPPKL